MDQTMPSLAPLCVHKDFCNYSLNVLISLAFWNVFFQQLLPSEVGFSLFSSLFYWSMSFYFIDKEKDKSNWAREISRIFFSCSFGLLTPSTCVYTCIKYLCLLFLLHLLLQVRDPMPAVYFFLIDVSMNAIQTGATAAACSAISQVISDLPVSSTFDGVHYLCLNFCITNSCQWYSVVFVLVFTRIYELFLSCSICVMHDHKLSVSCHPLPSTPHPHTRLRVHLFKLIIVYHFNLSFILFLLHQWKVLFLLKKPYNYLTTLK